MAVREPKNDGGTWVDRQILRWLGPSFQPDRLQLALLEACSTLQGKGITGSP